MELDKGMKEYKKEGVDKLKKAADGDVKTLVERIKAIANASKNYKSYSGIADNADGKVNFIFKTDGIEEE
jgi:putative membrane protein